MADLLNVALTALRAQQRALTTTANNIANASTPGYSRQRVELIERPTERLGTEFLGTGVDVALTRRVTDNLLLDQVRTAAGSFHRAEAFSSLAGSLDDMLAGSGLRLGDGVLRRAENGRPWTRRARNGDDAS